MAAASARSRSRQPAAFAEERRRRWRKSRPARRGCGGPPRRSRCTTTRSPSRVGVLLDDDGIGAARQDAAGEDAHRLAGAHRAVESGARRRLRRSAAASPAPSPRRRRAPRSRPWRRRRRAAGCAAPRHRPASTRPVRLGERRPSRRQAADAPSSTRGERLRRPGSERHAPTPSRGSGRICRRSSRSGGCPRCACRARPPCTMS